MFYTASITTTRTSPLPPTIRYFRPTKPTRIIKNLTNVALQNDIHNYLDWLNMKYTDRKNGSLAELPVKVSTGHHKYSTKNILSKFNISRIFLEHSPCSSKPCLHNSTCLSRSEESFQCICPVSFIGVYCEIGMWKNDLLKSQKISSLLLYR